MMKTRIYIAIDLQNDFIDGVFGTKEAKAIVPKVINFLNTLNEDDLVIFTRDTHNVYEETLEKELLPLHCLKNTSGWEINKEIYDAKKGEKVIINKPCFGSSELSMFLAHEIEDKEYKENEIEFIIFGLCTDICVISNALNLRSDFINTEISVIESLTAGTSVTNHEAAINIMKMNLIKII